MSRAIYLINPNADAPPYYGADVLTQYNLPPAVHVADLATATVAAMVPDDFEVTLCEQHLSGVDLDHPAQFVGLTGKSSQVGHMLTLAKAFRARGKKVIIGGPYASLSPEAVRDHCDILVRGEMEGIAPTLFDDLRRGTWLDTYEGGQADMLSSPIPRWDLYPNDGAFLGCVQTSRGCPFECEFCDVIQYVGRKQRHKSIDQVLRELSTLYELGYRGIFLADDNFTAYRRRAKELLTAIRDWNDRRAQGRVYLSTQLSIDAARDESLLRLCSQAGLRQVFIGIESPNEESLRETGKRQNLGISLSGHVERFLDHGIQVMGGMVVGFDADGSDIFERQYQFAMSTPIPIFTLGALVAPATTPLHARLAKSGRLTSDSNVGASVDPWYTNILPKQMSRDELYTGLRWLGNRLYQPDAFGDRVLRFIDTLKDPYPHAAGGSAQLRRVELNGTKVVGHIARQGRTEAVMMAKVMAAARKKPATKHHVITILFRYMQIRRMYQHGQFWEPSLFDQPLRLDSPSAQAKPSEAPSR